MVCGFAGSREYASGRDDRELYEYLARHMGPYRRLYGRASYRLNRDGGRLTLTTSLPVTVRGKNLKLEFTGDVTGRFSFGPFMDSCRQMKKAVLTDDLTGLYNRRFIGLALEEALSDPAASFSLMMADIDRFKAVNDTFGHVAGDRVLRGFAGLILGKIRKGRDWAARYGGDEFLICIKETGRKPVAKAAERIRRALMGRGFRCGGTVTRLTCSIGVCRVDKADKSRSVEELIESADRNLYKAKNAGRNRIVMD